jgi:hypothetical protein
MFIIVRVSLSDFFIIRIYTAKIVSAKLMLTQSVAVYVGLYFHFGP